ncbi:hypothetical protein BU24DRAFT_416969 [Aaosphaeria arxii CBS 175.79]|uniref:Uncharacterized protein n=1 Tax=Aaosphaeria arxii CBS 175.79 TaxID=1450172 RepID=A0A6A5Y7N9_9PLEO|nr:uncharacterized protein BU24DRAFT_416969 [Aaosphaeria arxii CBS 175.79]KAF2021306.1 hypothetical protein BU24DRAFT_416969 [Aaosphaeria arxii CBS 175.79]
MLSTTIAQIMFMPESGSASSCPLTVSTVPAPGMRSRNLSKLAWLYRRHCTVDGLGNPTRPNASNGKVCSFK